MTWFFQNHKWKIRHGITPQAISRKPHAPILRNHKEDETKVRFKKAYQSKDIIFRASNVRFKE